MKKLLAAILSMFVAANASAATFNFAEQSGEVQNQHRGRYKLNSFNILGNAANQQSSYDTQNNFYTIAQDRIYHGDFGQTNRDFTTAELNTMRTNLLNMVPYGIKAHIRHAYSNQNNNDASWPQIQRHINQLSSSVWGQADYMIAVMESGFFGAFGEHHDSSCLQTGTTGNCMSPDSPGCGIINDFYDYLIPRVPQIIRIGQRKAHYVGKAACAPYNVAPTNPGKGTSNNDRLVAWSDGLGKSDTFGYTLTCQNLQAELDYWEARKNLIGEPDGTWGTCSNNKCSSYSTFNKCCVQGGYPDAGCASGDYTKCSGNCDESASTCSEFKTRAKLLGLTLIRDCGSYPTVNIDNRECSVWYKLNTLGCLSDVQQKIGHRIRLYSSTIPATGKAGNNFSASVALANEGFAGPLVASKVYATFINKTSGARYDVATTIDTRDWLSNLNSAGNVKSPPETRTVPINVLLPTNMTNGDYRVALWVADQSEELRFRTGSIASQAWEVPYNMRFANQYVCSNGSTCNGSNGSRQNAWDTTLGINYIGETTIGGTPPTTTTTLPDDPEPPACVTNADCAEKPTDNPCTTDVCLPGGGGTTWPTVAGRLAISSDGNKFDCDDIQASAFHAALLSKTGNASKLVYWGRDDHHWDSGHTCGLYSGDDREIATEDSSVGVAEVWNAVMADDFDIGNFYSCQSDSSGNACGTNCQACVDALELEIEASSGGDPLTIIGAGPMDIIGRALDEAGCDGTPLAACANVTVISHSTWNDNHADTPDANESPQHSGWTWNEMKAANTTVTFTHIPDQNAGLKSAAGDLTPGHFYRDSGDSRLTVLWERILAADQDRVDISDAGMTWWVVQGKPADTTPDFAQMQAVFEAADGGTDAACSRSNNTAACDDGFFCTDTDVCGGGSCGGSGDPCSPGETCNETTDTCDTLDLGVIEAVYTACDNAGGYGITLPNVTVPDVDGRRLWVVLACYDTQYSQAACGAGTPAVTWAGQSVDDFVEGTTSGVASLGFANTLLYEMKAPSPGQGDVVALQVPSAFGGADRKALFAIVLRDVQPGDISEYTSEGSVVSLPRTDSVTTAAAAGTLIAFRTLVNHDGQVPTEQSQTVFLQDGCSPDGINILGTTQEVTGAGTYNFGFTTPLQSIDGYFGIVLPDYVSSTTTTTTTTVTTTSTTTTVTIGTGCAVDTPVGGCSGDCAIGEACATIGGKCGCVPIGNCWEMPLSVCTQGTCPVVGASCVEHAGRCMCLTAQSGRATCESCTFEGGAINP